ncbi:MAG: DUF1800 domain-containing protein [Phycisphaerae bacterium]|jgi:uncharacterized protein (DUF1800 family)
MSRAWILAVILLDLTFAPSALRAATDPVSLETIARDDWTRAAAAHLLRRAGFGGTPAEIDHLLALGLDGAVDSLVEFTQTPYDDPPPAIPEALRERPDRAERSELSEEQRRREIEERLQQERRALEAVRLWWIRRMVESPRPFEERMTLFWHGLFTSGAREVKRAEFMLEQNEFLRRHALDPFRDLLVGIAKDRAMLVYLDGVRNRKEQPNENFARELMELFTLGVGNYTEQDVKEAARAFTGWSFDEDGFIFRARAHDDGVKTVLKKTGRLDGTDVIDAILDQPAASRHLARKLLEHFVRPDPDRRLVESFAAVIRREQFRLRPIMKRLFKSQAFYDPGARGALVKSPVDVVVGTARTLGVPIVGLLEAERAMAQMGQALMQPPNVKGWDGGESWINTATLYTRHNAVGPLIYGGEARSLRRDESPSPLRDRIREGLLSATRASEALQPDEPPRKRAPSGGNGASMKAERPTQAASQPSGAESRQPMFDPVLWLTERNLRSPEQVVDFLAEHLLATKLPPEKRQLLVDYLRANEKRFDATARRTADRIRRTMHLICSTPEFQVY